MKKRMFKRIVAAAAVLTVIGVSLTAVLGRARECFSLFDDASLLAGYLSFTNGSPAAPRFTAAGAAECQLR